jgi:DNA (cytosine-5)-methyltransferase 1
MAAYYNENDPYAAQWLRNLVRGDLIAPGDVDERSIVDVSADDVRGYDQCHWFAGIGGWSYALRLAGWPDDRPVWTGSCPCQPFSAAGKGAGGKDERHLWPHWFRLIRERKPAIVFGENVAAAIGWGWLDAVLGDLEAEGYATGSAVLGAHSVGAPHIRQRLWFVADADQGQRGRLADGEGRERNGAAAGRQQSDGGAQSGGATGLVADTAVEGRSAQPQRHAGTDGRQATEPGRLRDAGLLADADGGDAGAEGLQRGGQQRQQPEDGGVGFWSDLVWLPCTDGKARPTQSGLFPLAHGVPGRVGRLRAYGNAIVAQCAAEFIKAVG